MFLYNLSFYFMFRSVGVEIKGDIRLNGHKADPNTLMGVSAYVQQLDLFTRVFTVREQLEFYVRVIHFKSNFI